MREPPREGAKDQSDLGSQGDVGCHADENPHCEPDGRADADCGGHW